MLFTVTIDNLREHQTSVNQGKWESLLLDWDLIMQIETEIVGVMETADAHCAILLTPQISIGSMRVEYQWVGKDAANCGPAEDDFFTSTVFKSLLNHLGV